MVTLFVKVFTVTFGQFNASLLNNYYFFFIIVPIIFTQNYFPTYIFSKSIQYNSHLPTIMRYLFGEHLN